MLDPFQEQDYVAVILSLVISLNLTFQYWQFSIQGPHISCRLLMHSCGVICGRSNILCPRCCRYHQNRYSPEIGVHQYLKKISFIPQIPMLPIVDILVRLIETVPKKYFKENHVMFSQDLKGNFVKNLILLVSNLILSAWQLKYIKGVPACLTSY